MSEVQTVRIQNPKGDGYVNINASDFDRSKHQLYSDAPAPSMSSTPATPPVVPQKESNDATHQQTSPQTVDAALASVLDRPAGEIYPLVANTDFDVVQLRVLQAHEAAGKARKTVLEAIDAKLKTAPLSKNGPTLAEYVAAGYKSENYPPDGYAVRE